MSAAIAWQQINYKLVLTVGGKTFGCVTPTPIESGAYVSGQADRHLFDSVDQAKDWLIEELLKSNLI